MPNLTPARRCLLGLSLGAVCAGALAQPAATLADYSLEQLSDIIVGPGAAAWPASGAPAVSADAPRAPSLLGSGFVRQQADVPQCVQSRPLWSQPGARSGWRSAAAGPEPRTPGRAD